MTSSSFAPGDQMPLIPGFREPDPLETFLRRRRIAALGGSLAALAGVAAVLFFAIRLSAPAVPDVPIPALAFDPGGPRKTMFTANVLTTVRGESVTYIDVGRLAAEQKKTAGRAKRVSIEPLTHTLVRIPDSFGAEKPVPITRFWHPIDEKMQSFLAYRYAGDEPPFPRERSHYSRPLAQKLDFGRNPSIMVEAGDLLYIYVYSDGVLSLYF